MTEEQYDKLKDGDVIFVNYKNDNKNEPNEYKPRNVVLLDKFSKTYCKVVAITDIANITNQKGIPVPAKSAIAKSMKLVKDSFINFDDCKTIPSQAVKYYNGVCPTEVFEQILKAKLD